jgi:carbon storage regulator
MLVLTRKNQESVVVGGSNDLDHVLKVTVLDIRGSQVKLGFDAHDHVPIHRSEVWERIRADESAFGDSPTVDTPAFSISAER